MPDHKRQRRPQLRLARRTATWALGFIGACYEIFITKTHDVATYAFIGVLLGFSDLLHDLISKDDGRDK